MLAQLLGMGRKKDPPKHNSTSNDAPESPIERQDSEDRSSATGALLPGGAALSPSAVSANTAATGQTTMATPDPISASTLHRLNACVDAATTSSSSSVTGCQAESNCDCCSAAAGNTAAACHGTSAGSGAGVPTGGVPGPGGRGSLAPSPPSGPAAFSSPAVTTAVVQQPLGQKQAFASEAAAVERGLNLQLGDTGAATESQLGGQQLEAAKKLRNLLTTNRERVVQEMLSRGWVPLLLRWLGLAHRPNLQVEALSALTTVAQTTTEHTSLLLKHGAVGTLVSLLKSPSLEMVEQAMWVLGKLAQDGPDGTTTARDAVLQAGVLGPLVRCLEQHSTLLSLQRIGAWSLFNLLDGQPRPTIDVATVNTVMPAINRLLMAGDSEVLSHACSALSHLCDGSAAHIKVVVESGVCKRLVQLLDHPSSQVVKPALRTIGNVVCAEDDADYTEAILEAGSVVCLKKLIAHPNREIQKEACWTLSNIAAGSVSQIQSVLDSGAMPQLIKLATSADTESEVRSEAFWVVLNAASCGSDAQIEYLVSQGCVQILSDLLGESSMVMMALEGIERVLSVGDLRVVRNAIASHSHGDQGPEGEGGVGDHGEGGHCMECASVAAGQGGVVGEGLGAGEAGAYTNPYACMLTPEKIQALEAHKNSAVAKRANRVWARYFVTCAICRGSFSRHGSSAAFCTECNCHVCGTCDCTIFHLAYQDKLWEEMEGKEKRGKKAQQTAKKNKKAKKREKKKNAAKELAEEATVPSKGNKAGGRGAGDKNPPAGGGKRANGNGGVNQKGDGDDDAGGVSAQQRSQSLGKKSQGHDRSDSPNKASSSASTESNSEDEYNPSSCPPPTNAPGQYAPNGPLPATSAAAALINATAMAVTSAATAAAAKKSKNGADGRTVSPTTTVTPPKKSRGSSSGTAVVASPTAGSPLRDGKSPPAADDSSSSSSRKVEEERAQRRAGKKQGRRDQQGQQQQQHSKSLFSALSSSSSSGSSAAGNSSAASSSSSGRATPAAANSSRVPDDDDEEPWVVVGGAGGKRAGGSAKTKPQQQRAPAPAPTGGAAPKTSSVVWASESSPADVAVRAVTPARPIPATAAVPPRVPAAAPPAHAQGGIASGGGAGGGGNAWGGGGSAAALKPSAVPPAMAPSNNPHSTLSSSAANGTTTANGPLAPQRPGPRPGPGPGSVWGASASIADARPKPFLVAAAATAATGNSGAGSSSSPAAVSAAVVAGSAPGFVGQAGTSRAPGGSANRAGVIGPRPQGTSVTGKPAGSSAVLVPDARGVLAHTVGSKAAAAAVPVARVKGKGGQGAVGGGGGGEDEKLVRNVSQGSEALRENEKLVSFLLETGSILALAQRLEDEEEWRRAAPSPINSRPG